MFENNVLLLITSLVLFCLAGCNSRNMPETQSKAKSVVFTANPKTDSECVGRAEQLLRKNESQQAQSLLEKCLLRWPDSSKVNLLLGYAFARQGEYEQAEKQFLKIEKLINSPTDRISLHLGLAAVLDKQGKAVEADKRYSAALAIDPSLSKIIDEVEKQRLWPKAVYIEDKETKGKLSDRLSRIEKRLKKIQRR